MPKPPPIATPVAGRLAEFDSLELGPVTNAKLWRNPCWFAYRFNYLALRYNGPLYSWIERTYGLLRPEYAVIYALGLCEKATARDIGASSGFPKNTLSRAIQSLERRGLLRRERQPEDRRSFLLSLTSHGRAVFDETLPSFVGLQDEMMKPLSAGERETLSALLAKIVLHTLAWPEGAVRVGAPAVPSPSEIVAPS